MPGHGSHNGDLCNDFYYRTCGNDDDCQRAGYRCSDPIDGCVSSQCECDPSTGLPGRCTNDCLNDVGLCVLADEPDVAGEEAQILPTAGRSSPTDGNLADGGTRAGGSIHADPTGGTPVDDATPMTDGRLTDRDVEQTENDSNILERPQTNDESGSDDDGILQNDGEGGGGRLDHSVHADATGGSKSIPMGGGGCSVSLVGSVSGSLASKVLLFLGMGVIIRRRRIHSAQDR